MIQIFRKEWLTEILWIWCFEWSRWYVSREVWLVVGRSRVWGYKCGSFFSQEEGGFLPLVTAKYFWCQEEKISRWMFVPVVSGFLEKNLLDLVTQKLCNIVVCICRCVGILVIAMMESVRIIFLGKWLVVLLHIVLRRIHWWSEWNYQRVW